jgi:hypothetical protein
MGQQQRHFRRCIRMSALSPIASRQRACHDVRKVPVTDIMLPTTEGLRKHTSDCSRSNLPEQFGRP